MSSNKMNQLMKLSKIQWMLPVTVRGSVRESEMEDLGSAMSWFLIKSSSPCMHLINLETIWNSEERKENYMLHVKYLIQCPESVTDWQVAHKPDNGLYIVTDSGSTYYIDLLALQTCQLSKEDALQTLTADNCVHQAADVPQVKRALILPSALMLLRRAANQWLVEIYEKEGSMPMECPAFSFAIPQYDSCLHPGRTHQEDSDALVYCIHTADMHFTDRRNTRSLLVEPNLFKNLFGDNTLLARAPVILLAFHSGYIVWFPLKPQSGTQQWRLLVDITDAPVSIHALRITSYWDGIQDAAPAADVQSLVIVGRSGRMTLMVSQKGRITHQQAHFTGPVLCSLLLDTGLLYSTGRAVHCIHFDKPRGEDAWDMTKWDYGGITDMCPASEPGSLLPPADVTILTATFRGTLATLTLDQSGAVPWVQSSPGSGQQLKDLLTGIVSASKVIASMEETLNKQQEALKQLALASLTCSTMKSKAYHGSELTGGTRADCSVSPFVVDFHVCSSQVPGQYTIMGKVSNQSAVTCCGWHISISLNTTMPTHWDHHPKPVGLSVPLPKLSRGEHAIVAMPVRDLAVTQTGCALRLVSCLVLHVDPTALCDRANAKLCAGPKAVHIPLPVKTLDILDFARPVPRESCAKVQQWKAVGVGETVATASRQRYHLSGLGPAPEDGGVLKQSSTSSLLLKFDTALPEEEQELQLLLGGATLAAYWSEGTLSVLTPSNTTMQLSLSRMGKTAPQHWLVKICAPQLQQLLHLRIALMKRVAKSALPISLVPLLPQGKDFAKLIDMQAQSQNLVEKSNSGNTDVVKPLVAMYNVLRLLPAAAPSSQ